MTCTTHHICDCLRERLKLFGYEIKKLQAQNLKMKQALEKIIEMNYQTAQDKYGDKSKADTWCCVVVAKEALK